MLFGVHADETMKAHVGPSTWEAMRPPWPHLLMWREWRPEVSGLRSVNG